MMKLFLMSFLFIATSAFARTYTCQENKPEGMHVQVIRPKTSVVIKELADITDDVSFGRHFDYVYRVEVTVTEKIQNSIKMQKTYVVTATSEDVIYTVSAKRKHGLYVRIYLDEMDGGSITYKDANGKKKEVSLVCQ
jgi:hypothetical protein